MSKAKVITIDAAAACTLECYSCARQERKNRFGLKPSVGNHYITVKEIIFLKQFYDYFSICGQMSDPIFNPYLIEILGELSDKIVHINTAATNKKLGIDWYKKAFDANPKALWTIGIDGIDDRSEFHRVNQDTDLLFEVLKLGAKKNINIEWQYIVFSYNENDIETAKKMAKEMGVTFRLLLSGRFRKHDVLKPKNKDYYIC